MHLPSVDFKYVRNKQIEMTAVGITYFEKPSRDKNIDDCQQIGVKFERNFLKSATVDSISDKLIIHLK